MNCPHCGLNHKDVIEESLLLLSKEDKKTAEELKPCPFCGDDDPSYTEGRMGVPSIIGHYIECARCGACSRMTETKVEAAALWNQRTNK